MSEWVSEWMGGRTHPVLSASVSHIAENLGMEETKFREVSIFRNVTFKRILSIDHVIQSSLFMCYFLSSVTRAYVLDMAG